jgi:hypothetical protein
MDVAWVPGGDPDSLLAKQLYTDRVNSATSLDTKLVSVPSKRLTDVITEVDTNSTFTKPLADLILVSHGNDTGWLKIDLDSAPDKSITYQVLRSILDATNPARRTALRLPSTLYTKPDGTQAATRVVLAGCRVGGAPKFVDAFKQVLGGKVPVVASKYLHEFSPTWRRFRGRKAPPPQLLGTFEFLSYGFTATSLASMRIDPLVDALKKNPKNTYKGGTAVPVARWKPWLKDVPLDRFGEFPVRLSVPLGQTVADQKQLTPAKLRHLPRTYTVHLKNPTATDKTVTGLKTKMQADPTCQASYPFPMWEQYGKADFDTFFASFNWTPEAGKDKDGDPQVTWSGMSHEYTLFIPVTEPADRGNLIFDFFPPRGSTTFSPVIGINDGDTNLFYRTP